MKNLLIFLWICLTPLLKNTQFDKFDLMILRKCGKFKVLELLLNQIEMFTSTKNKKIKYQKT